MSHEAGRLIKDQFSIDWLDYHGRYDSKLIAAVDVDTGRRYTYGEFNDRIHRLAAGLRERHPDSLLMFSGLPDLARFPALPWPLSGLLGWRSRCLDRALAQFCAGQAKTGYYPVNIRDDDDFAPDGFHPGVVGIAAWADAGKIVNLPGLRLRRAKLREISVNSRNLPDRAETSS